MFDIIINVLGMCGNRLLSATVVHKSGSKTSKKLQTKLIANNDSELAVA